MLLKCYYIFIYMAGFLKLCYCQRQNAPGVNFGIGKKYAVYFVQSPYTKSDHETWLCGGALVSPTQILTAAACLVEAENIYAIAGYKKFVDAKDIENDECTRSRKQRVVKILVPTEYKLAYENPAQWINVDVGVAIVEKPYNFTDLTYRIYCSYEPQPIFVNFENKYELASTRAVALGWGNMVPEHQGNMNSQLLQESSTVIVDKTICANTVNTQEIVYIIEKYLLCASNNMNDVGQEPRVENETNKDCTVRRYDLTRATDNNGCFEDDFGFRRHDEKINNDTDKKNEMNEEMSQRNYSEMRNETSTNYLYTSLNSRRSSASAIGPCQSGHGCPLIRWVGDKEVIIGVASNANKNDNCKGPFLYVSTAATSKIIKCLLETNSMTRKFCNQEISDKRYEVQEIDITWPDYVTKPVPIAMPIIKRSIPDDGSLVHRPTKDIVKDQPQQQGRPYDPAFQQPRSQTFDHQPEQTFNRGQSFRQPRTQMEDQPPAPKPVPRNGQPNDQQGKPFGSPMGGPSPDMQYGQPPAQQYKPPAVPQYEPPPGQQFEQPPGPQYDQPMGQQYEPPAGPQYGAPPGQQYEPQPGSQYGPSMGQQFEPPPVQQFEPPPMGQEYEAPPGQPYGAPQDQQYEPHPGQQYEPPQGQQYEPQPGQQYEEQVGSQYQPPPEQQYEPQPGPPQQNEGQPGQQNEAQPGQQYEPPPVEQYEQLPGRPNEPPPGQQYDPSAGQQYEPPPGQQYEPQPGQQYEPPLGQPYKSSLNQPSDSPLKQPYKSPLFQPSESPLGQQYETPPRQRYDQPPRQYEPPLRPQYETSSSQYRGLPTQSYDFQPSPRYGQPIASQYKPPIVQPFKKPQGPQFGQSLGQQFGQTLGQQLGQSQGQLGQSQGQLGQSQGQLGQSQQHQGQSQQIGQSQHLGQSEGQHVSQTQEGQQLGQSQGQHLGQSQGQGQQNSQSKSYEPPYEDIFSEQYQSPSKHTPEQSFMQSQKQQSNSQTYDQKPFKSYQQPADTRFQKPLDQMFSQSRDPPTGDEPPSPLDPQGREESFDQLYSRLHEPSFDLPHEVNVPQYSGPPDDGFDELDRGAEQVSNQQAAARQVTTEQTNVARNDDVRVRPQMPVDYQNDYFFYSYRRNGSGT